VRTDVVGVATAAAGPPSSTVVATWHSVRDLSRRLTVQLVALGLVLAGGLTVPLDEPPGTHWSFLVPFVLFVGHVLLGLLVLVDSLRLAVRSSPLGPDARGLVLVGCGCCLTAVGSGAVSVLGLVDRSPAPLMLLGWFVALVVYTRAWAISAGVLRAARATQ
jgi:hypothetical protein